MAEQGSFMRVGEFSCVHCDFKCDGNDSEKVMGHVHTHPENIVVPKLPKLDYQIHPLMDSGFKDGLKQGRSEVLAACIADVDAALAIFMENDERSKNEKLFVGGACLAIKNRIGQLQPTAKDLKELLRQERLDEAQRWHRMVVIEHMKPMTHLQKFAWGQERIAELEKVRASLVKG